MLFRGVTSLSTFILCMISYLSQMDTTIINFKSSDTNYALVIGLLHKYWANLAYRHNQSDPQMLIKQLIVPCFDNPTLRDLDDIQTDSLVSVLNCASSEESHPQIHLPVWIRSAVQLSIPAFLSSAISASALLPSVRNAAQFWGHQNVFSQRWNCGRNIVVPSLCLQENSEIARSVGTFLFVLRP